MTTRPIHFQTLLGNTKDVPELMSYQPVANSNYPPFGYRPKMPCCYHSRSNLTPTIRLLPEHSKNDVIIPANWVADSRITVSQDVDSSLQVKKSE